MGEDTQSDGMTAEKVLAMARDGEKPHCHEPTCVCRTRAHEDAVAGLAYLAAVEWVASMPFHPVDSTRCGRPLVMGEDGKWRCTTAGCKTYERGYSYEYDERAAPGFGHAIESRRLAKEAHRALDAMIAEYTRLEVEEASRNTSTTTASASETKGES